MYQNSVIFLFVLYALLVSHIGKVLIQKPGVSQRYPSGSCYACVLHHLYYDKYTSTLTALLHFIKVMFFQHPTSTLLCNRIQVHLHSKVCRCNTVCYSFPGKVLYGITPVQDYAFYDHKHTTYMIAFRRITLGQYMCNAYYNINVLRVWYYIFPDSASTHNVNCLEVSIPFLDNPGKVLFIKQKKKSY